MSTSGGGKRTANIILADFVLGAGCSLRAERAGYPADLPVAVRAGDPGNVEVPLNGSG